ncbi:MAG: immunoglobulin domain-containing protein [Verrucomicrobia bacterium]|nr:immunoglobulin domain-containing protein [Verrucomicrobiota bacterium]
MQSHSLFSVFTFALLSFCLSPIPGSQAQDGTLDPVFDPGGGAQYLPIIRSTVTQPDGRFFVFGDFDSLNGARYPSIVRWISEDSLDPTFKPRTSEPPRIQGQIRAAALLPDGRLLIGGNLVIYGSTFSDIRSSLGRLNADGSVDISFNNTFSSGVVNAIGLQSDGRILVGGQFLVLQGTTNMVSFLRLTANGARDNSYPQRVAAGGSVQFIQVVTNDTANPNAARIGGVLPEVTGSRTNYLLSLKVDGTVESTYGGAGAVNGAVVSRLSQADGKLLLAGFFTQANGVPWNHVLRLNADNTPDPTFDIGSGADAEVLAAAVQADGKTVLAGGFTSFNGTPCGGIIRLNAGGSIDSTFKVGSGANDRIYQMQLRPNGELLLMGAFSAFNGAARGGIARLSSDGSLLASFAGLNPTSLTRCGVYATAVQPDGRFLIGGDFNAVRGRNLPGIARLNPDGTLDASFRPGVGVDGQVQHIAIDAEGRILLAGAFRAVQGAVRTSLARLQPDGSLDLSFAPTLVKLDGTPGSLSRTIPLSNGQALIGGHFRSLNGASRSYFARLNTDGSADSSFDAQIVIQGRDPLNPSRILTGQSPTVEAIAPQPDGRIVIGGYVTWDGLARGYVMRLNSNGQMDANFIPNSVAANVVITAGTVRDVALLANAKILAGGGFAEIITPGFTRPRRGGIVRFEANGQLDVGFDTGLGANGEVRALALQSDDKIVIGGEFQRYNLPDISQPNNRIRVARLNANGSLDETFQPGTGANDTVNTVIWLPTGRALIGGVFTNYNGTIRPGLARLIAQTLSTTTPPVVSLVSPSSGAVFTAPATIILSAEAKDADGTVAKVEFYFGTTKLGEDTSAPYSFTWTNVVAGTYSLTAKATDNQGASATSAEMKVTINAPLQPPVITIPPQSQTVSVGGIATFTVTVSGSEPLTYEWRKEGKPISGAAQATLTLSNVQALDAAAYTVVVSNAAGSVTSSPVTLTVNSGGCVPPPAGLTGWWPGEGSFSNLVATNQGVPLGKVSFAAGEVSQTFSFASDGDGITIPHDSLFDVQASGFTVEFWMRGIKNQPQSLYLVADKSHGWADSKGWAFQGFSDNGKLSFFIGAGGAVSTDFIGVTSGADLLDGVFHHVAGTWDGSRVRLYVDRTLQGEAALSTPANNTRPVNVGYSWGGGSPNRFFRGQVDELSIYRSALSSNEVAAIFSAGSAGKCKLTVNVPVITSTPTATGQVGGAFIYQIIASNNPTNYAASGLPAGLSVNPVSGLISGTPPAAGTNTVTLSAANAGGTATMTLTLLIAPRMQPLAIVVSPQSQTVLAGSNVTFTVTASGGGPLSYQWRKDGSPISSATNATLTLNNVQPSYAGDYTVVVKSAIGTVTSALAPLRVFSAAEYRFSAWVQASQLPVGSDSPSAAPSGDGVPNLLKFAMGLDPKVASRTSLVTPATYSQAGREFAGLAFSRAKNATGIQLYLEASSNLRDWQEVSATMEKLADLDAQREWVRLTERTPINTESARFYRLKVNLDRGSLAGDLTLGVNVQVSTTPIGPQGGTLAVNRPGDPLHGLQIVVPTNTYDTSTPFAISYRPIQGHTYGEAIHPITPLIRVENGGQFVSNMMSVTVPIALPPEHFALAFMVDSVSRKLEGMPLVEVTSNSITVGTHHFSDFFVSIIPLDRLLEEVDTGFRPGVDDWEFTNRGSWLASGGHCAGQTLSALWYYYEKRLKEGAPPLYNRFDNQGYPFRTPSFGQDNVNGYALASRVQRDIKWASFANSFWYNLNLIDRNTYRAFLYSMQVTGEPQTMGIYRQGGGHALVAYRAIEGILFVADPNYPGNLDRHVNFNRVTGRFDPYFSGPNADDLGHSYPRIVYSAKTTMIDWRAIAARWQEFENGTIRWSHFPNYFATLADASGTELGDIESVFDWPVFNTDSDRIQIRESDADGFRFFETDGRRRPAPDWSLALNEGENVIGFEVYRNTAAAGSSPTYDWIDFKWVRINRIPVNQQPVTLSISPSSVTMAPNATQSFIVTVSGTTNLVDLRWRVQEGTAGGSLLPILAATNLYTAPATPGTYHIIVSSDADTNRTATATVTVSALEYHTLFFGDGTLREEWWTNEQGRRERTWKTYWRSGGVNIERDYVDGKLNGLFVTYFETGTKASESNWSNDKLHGSKTEWWGNGKKMWEGTYLNGALNGPVIEYDPFGAKSIEFTYRDDKKNGPSIQYYTSGANIGAMRVVGNYVDDKQHGLFTWYYDDGAKSGEQNYANGVLDGPDIGWYRVGTKEHEGAYTMGRKTGRWTYYKDDGSVDRVENYP